MFTASVCTITRSVYSQSSVDSDDLRCGAAAVKSKAGYVLSVCLHISVCKHCPMFTYSTLAGSIARHTRCSSKIIIQIVYRQGTTALGAYCHGISSFLITNMFKYLVTTQLSCSWDGLFVMLEEVIT